MIRFTIRNGLWVTEAKARTAQGRSLSLHQKQNASDDGEQRQYVAAVSEAEF